MKTRMPYIVTSGSAFRKEGMSMRQRALWLGTVVLFAGAGYARDYVTPNGSTVDWEFDGSSAERKAESSSWPATYDYQDICVIPANMDVGFWIKVANAKDLVLKLKQVEIHKYSGSVDVLIVCNVNIQVSVVWSKADGINLGSSYGGNATVTPSALDAPGGTVTVGLTLTNVDLSNLQGGQNCLQVGTITLKVRPNMVPRLASGC
jgi:hypothetical protein